MELKSITIDNEGIITIHTDKGIKTIQYHNPFYQAYRTQLETISFQAYTFDDKKTKYYESQEDSSISQRLNSAPGEWSKDDILDKPHTSKRPNDTYFNDEWNK